MNIKNILIWLSIILFIIALTQKCYCTTLSCGDSIAVFLFGVLGVFYGGAALTWLANPLLLFSWVFSKRKRLSLSLSFLSTLIALSFLFFDEIIEDEGGNYRQIINYELGYWLWVGSNMVMLICNSLIWIKNRNTP